MDVVMSPEVYVPLLSALGGAVIGSAATVLTVWLQLRSQSRRERVRQATELVLNERAMLLEIARKENRGLTLPPASLAITHYLDTLSAIEKGGYSRDVMRKLDARYTELEDFAFELERQRRERRQANRNPAGT
jgi:hypothetical protein